MPTSDHADVVDGQADALATGDHGLLAATDTAPLARLSPRGFWERLRRGTDGDALAGAHSRR
jgi:hypothetical protein